MVVDITTTGFQQARGPAEGNHRQGATDRGQQLGQGQQALAVPVGIDVLDDQVLGLLQADPRFLDHQLVDLGQVGGRQAAFFAAFRLHGADHPGQGRLDVEQGAGDVHQHRVVRLTLALDQAQDHRRLVDDDLARLAEAEHRQGIGDLPQGRQQARQFIGVLAVTAYEQVQALLASHQFFAQRRHHRTHGIAVRAGQAGALLIDHRRVGQGLIQAITVFQGEHLRRRLPRLGDIEQQAFEQFFRGRLVDSGNALLQQALEFLVGVLEQAAQGRAVGDGASEHAFDQRRGDLPERPQRGIQAEGFKAGEDLGHIPEIGFVVLFAQQADQGGLQHLPQLAQQGRQLRRGQFGEGRLVQWRQFRQGRAEQAGFRQQAFTPGAAQVVEQRQHHQRQVAAGTVDPVQVQRHLPQGLAQQFQRFRQIHHPPLLHGQGQGFGFLGEQGRAVELDHLQAAMDLVNAFQAFGDVLGRMRRLVERIQGLARLFQGIGDFALDPFEGHIVVLIAHDDSTNGFHAHLAQQAG